jgi:hypothetical protein
VPPTITHALNTFGPLLRGRWGLLRKFARLPAHDHTVGKDVCPPTVDRSRNCFVTHSHPLLPLLQRRIAGAIPSRFNIIHVPHPLWILRARQHPTAALGRYRPVATNSVFFSLATCFARSTGRIRPKAVLRPTKIHTKEVACPTTLSQKSLTNRSP